MKVTFADSFWKSLRVMARHQTWWYTTYEVFRYKIPMFFENLWFFRKQLWEFRSWDYSFNLEMFARSLEKTSNTLEFHGSEVDVTRLKKVQKINRVIEIIKNIRESNYLSKAELELGEIILRNDWMFTDEEQNPEIIAHNKKIYDRADILQELEWNELFDILKGQNFDEYRTLMDGLSPEEKNKMNVWNDWYDGSGIRNWWD
jgi:hypothetical protein